MPDLFKSESSSTGPGTYTRISSKGSGAALIVIGDLKTENVLIVTKYGYSQKAKVQYRSVLGGDIYIYPLGNEMGTIQVSGIVPYRTCDNDSIGEGFKALAKFYHDNRVSNAKNAQKQLSITLPGLEGYATRCYLESLSISGTDPKNLLFGFDLIFRVAPKGDA